MQQEMLTQEAEIPNGHLSKENTDLLVIDHVSYCEQNLKHYQWQDALLAKIISSVFLVFSI